MSASSIDRYDSFKHSFEKVLAAVPIRNDETCFGERDDTILTTEIQVHDLLFPPVRTLCPCSGKFASFQCSSGLFVESWHRDSIPKPPPIFKEQDYRYISTQLSGAISPVEAERSLATINRSSRRSTDFDKDQGKLLGGTIDFVLSSMQMRSQLTLKFSRVSHFLFDALQGQSAARMSCLPKDQEDLSAKIHRFWNQESLPNCSLQLQRMAPKVSIMTILSSIVLKVDWQLTVQELVNKRHFCSLDASEGKFYIFPLMSF